MSKTQSTNHYYVVICGPLASGKTSLTRILVDCFGWRPIYEDLSSHLYFNDYYRDMQKWGFHTAIYFLIRALELQPQIKKLLTENSTCQDWYVVEHHEVYNHHMFQTGILDERDYTTCGRLHNILMTHLVQPDLIVYLKAKTDIILSRLARRHREGEVSGLSSGYIDNLIRRYDSWIRTVASPVLQVDTDVYDFVNNEEAKTNILRQIQEFLY